MGMRARAQGVQGLAHGERGEKRPAEGNGCSAAQPVPNVHVIHDRYSLDRAGPQTVRPALVSHLTNLPGPVEAHRSRSGHDYFVTVVDFSQLLLVPPGPVTDLSLVQVLVLLSQLPEDWVCTELSRGPVVVDERW